MKKRFTFCLLSFLSLILVSNPLLTLGAVSKTGVPNKPINLASRSTGKKSGLSPTSSTSRKRSIKTKQEAALNGQTTTLLSDGKLLLIGGETNEGVSNQGFIKDPRAGEIIAVAGGLRQARSWHSATTLPDGKVLILGGVNSEGRAESAAEIFDPETQRFESLPNVKLVARTHHTATLLMDGRVLIAGGRSTTGKTLKSIELFDPQTEDVVSVKSKLKTARSSHTATLLPNGNVLLWGGIDNQGKTLQNGETFLAEVSNKKVNGVGRIMAVEAFPEQMYSDYPQLEASLPEDGAKEMPQDTRIALRFSKLLRVESLNADTVTLNGQYGKIEAKIVPAENGMLAFITPKTLLLPGATYTVYVAKASDANNNDIAPISLTFTTTGRQQNLDLSDGEAWRPDLGNLDGDWQSHRSDSAWRSLPPLQAPEGVTALAGQVLKLNDKPLANVTL